VGYNLLELLVEELTGIDFATYIEISALFGFVADAYGFGHFIETLPDGRKAVSA